MTGKNYWSWAGHLGRNLRKPSVGTAVLIAAIAAAPIASGQAADLPDSVKALIPAAKKEESFSLFGYSFNPRQQDKIKAAISEYYGFPIEIHFSRGSHVRKTAELIQAVKQGVPTNLDVFWSSSTQIVLLQKAGALVEINWPKTFGVSQDLQRGDTGIRSHDTMLSAVLYNTNLVKPSEAPKTYDDLLDPKWKGRIATPRSPNPWANLAFAMGDEKVTELLTRLVRDQDMKMLPTYPDVRSRVSTGEFALGVGPDAFTLKRQGAPIDEAPVNPLVLSPAAYNVMTDAKSPNLAKLWCYWATGEDGQKVMAEQWGAAMVNTPGSETYKLAQQVETVALLTHEFAITQFVELATRYSKIMGIR